MSQPPEHPSLEDQIRGLDGTIYTSGKGEQYDAFVNMYRLLPEGPMSRTIGADLFIDFGPTQPKMHVRPLAMAGDALVAQDMRDPRSAQKHPTYCLFRGSMYFAEGDEDTYGLDAISQVALALLSDNKSLIGRMDSGVRVAYNPQTFCKDARFIYAPAHSLEAMRTFEMKLRTAQEPVGGVLMTVLTGPNTPLTLFVENNYQMTEPVKGMMQPGEGGFRQLLSYVPES